MPTLSSGTNGCLIGALIVYHLFLASLLKLVLTLDSLLFITSTTVPTGHLFGVFSDRSEDRWRNTLLMKRWAN